MGGLNLHILPLCKLCKNGETSCSIQNQRQLPTPPATEEDKTRFTALAVACAEAVRKQNAAALATLESEINRIVYRLFALTPTEIELIESSLS